MMIEPGEGEAIPGVSIPSEFYWVLKNPAPLAGMRMPRSDFPWSEVAKHGISRLVALHRGSYDPSPLIVISEELEDLVHGRPPSNPEREREAITRVSQRIVASLRASQGVVVHCFGGRGRTGTVLGCTLAGLGYDPLEVIAYLNRIHEARGTQGWPEAEWQATIVRDCAVLADPANSSLGS